MIVSCNKSLGTRKYIEYKTRRKGGEGDRVVGERERRSMEAANDVADGTFADIGALVSLSVGST